MEQSHRDDKGVEEKEVRNYRVKERKTPDGRIQLTGSEDAEQEKVVCWAKLMSNAYPDLELLYHVPNGGSRNKAEASKLRRMGVRAGVPDLVLPVPRAGYAGLYIELKVGENRPSNSQKDWLEKLTIQAAQPAVSLTPENREESDRQIDIPVESPEEELADKIGLAEVLKSLPEEDRLIIQLRFYGGKTQSDTAKLLHTTQVQISRRERKILKVMRDRLLDE